MPVNEKPQYGAIEAGGTKFVCAGGTGPEDLRTVQFDTTTLTETLSKTISFFKQQNEQSPLKAIGIGSFGPINLDRNSETYGYITSTPKLNWANTNFVGAIKSEFNIPIGFDTDVNAAALGENYWGAARGISDFLYLTVGTGIGGGGLINGKRMHGLVHPEMGHFFIPQAATDHYQGRCPFHKNQCFEGLASGPAIEERWGMPAKELHSEHEAWDLEAHYIALALTNYICTLSPKRIIIGGGVMKQRQLFPLVRQNVSKMLNQYIQSDQIIYNMESYIVPPELGNQSGVLGAIALAMEEG